MMCPHPQAVNNRITLHADNMAHVRLQPFVLRQWLQQYDNQSREAMLGEVMKLLQDKVIQPFSGTSMLSAAC